MERFIFRLLGLFNWYKVARRGPGAMLRREERIQGYRLVNRIVGRPRRRR
jgi:hypothetical protein